VRSDVANTQREPQKKRDSMLLLNDSLVYLLPHAKDARVPSQIPVQNVVTCEGTGIDPPPPTPLSTTAHKSLPPPFQLWGELKKSVKRKMARYYYDKR
jgi:hypothetical protein